MESFKGKNVIMTGATGGIGSEVVTQLEKYCKPSLILYFSGNKIVVLLQNTGKFAEAIKDPQVKHSDKILKVPLNLKEPY